MQKFVKSVFAGLCLSAILFLIAPSLVQAQIAAHTTDLAGFIGGRNVIGPSDADIPYFGGSVGYNVVPSFTILGEYTFMPMGTGTQNGIKATENAQTYGGAIHYNLLNVGRVGSYFVASLDGEQATWTGKPSVNGYTAGFGGGWIFFCGNNWGIRPEVRANRQELMNVPGGGYYYTNFANGPAGNYSTVYVSGTVSLFYQFGGKAKKK